MTSFETTRAVNHRASDMFDLVADVENYPKFVPLCDALVVRDRTKDDAGNDLILADMTVAFKLFRETFRSKVVLDRDDWTIAATYVDGPFHHMENRWNFAPASDDGCTVTFFIDYALRSRALQLIAGTVFETAFRRFAEAFEQRADVVYGKPNHTPSLGDQWARSGT